MALEDLQASLGELDKSLASIEAVVDPDAKRAEIAALEQQVSAPDLWDDQENAQKVTSRLSAVQAELERVAGLRSRLDDTAVLVELAAEEGDADSLAEAEADITRLRSEIG